MNKMPSWPVLTRVGAPRGGPQGPPAHPHPDCHAGRHSLTAWAMCACEGRIRDHDKAAGAGCAVTFRSCRHMACFYVEERGRAT
jgi:hypothetical protein